MNFVNPLTIQCPILAYLKKKASISLKITCTDNTADMELDEDVDSALLARNTPSYVGRDFQDLRQMAKKMAKTRVINQMANKWFDPPDFESILKVQESCKNDDR